MDFKKLAIGYIIFLLVICGIGAYVLKTDNSTIDTTENNTTIENNTLNTSYVGNTSDLYNIQGVGYALSSPLNIPLDQNYPFSESARTFSVRGISYLKLYKESDNNKFIAHVYEFRFESETVACQFLNTLITSTNGSPHYILDGPAYEGSFYGADIDIIGLNGYDAETYAAAKEKDSVSPDVSRVYIIINEDATDGEFYIASSYTTLAMQNKLINSGMVFKFLGSTLVQTTTDLGTQLLKEMVGMVS